MAEINQSAPEKTTELLRQQEIRESLGEIATQAERKETKNWLGRLGDKLGLGRKSKKERAKLKQSIVDENGNKYKHKDTHKEKIRGNISPDMYTSYFTQPETVPSSLKLAEWMNKYPLDQKGLDTFLCEPALSNSFFWRNPDAQKLVDQDPILEIRNNKVYFLNGAVENQTVFTFSQFEDVMNGRKIKYGPKIDYTQIEQNSVEIEYDRCCQMAQDVCQQYPGVLTQNNCGPDQVMITSQNTGISHSPIQVVNGQFCGDYQMDCLQGSFQLPPTEFCDYVESCGGCTTALQECNTLGQDEFCDVECGDACMGLDGLTEGVSHETLAQGIDQDDMYLDDIEDETLEDLEAKLKDLKLKKRANRSKLSPAELLALGGILTGGGMVAANNLSLTAATAGGSVGEVLGGVAVKSTAGLGLPTLGSSLNTIGNVLRGATSVSALSAGVVAWPLLLTGAATFVVAKVIKKLRQVKARREAERRELGMSKKEYRAFRKTRKKEAKAARKKLKREYIDKYSRSMWRKKKRADRKIKRANRKEAFHEAKIGIKETRRDIRRKKKANKRKNK